VELSRKIIPRKSWALYGLVGLIVLLGISALMGGARLRAKLASKSPFTQCTPDKRIWCEPGSEQFAVLVAGSLGQAIAKVERAHFASFLEPVRIYTYAGIESFVLHSGSNPHLRGVTVDGDLHLSPVALDVPMSLAPLVVHELSHVHLSQHLNMISFNRLPGWFLEGLATTVSDGAGAENVSEHDALLSMAAGRCIVPNEATGWMGGGRSGPPGMRSHMFYRQSAMFVNYLRSVDERRFMRALQALYVGKSLSEALAEAYGIGIAALWQQFLKSRQGNTCTS
jgi:hypothetical protein